MFSHSYKKILSFLPWLMILIGAILRLIIFFKNNGLFLDEVNVALNIYDRSVAQLFQPLDNNQYAPPGFLVMLKLFTNTFNYSEYFFRLFPLLCSLVSLWLMFLVLKKYVTLEVIWYPLALMAVGFIYIRYGTMIKQYSSDIMIILLLILLTLKEDITQGNATRFSLKWVLAGGLAIWFSMPALFMLASVGVYYLLQITKGKAYRKLIPMAIISLLWLLQFGIYYHLLLRYQLADDYLQNWHYDFFPDFATLNKERWEHNWLLIKNLLVSLGGHWTLSFVFHIGMLLLGMVYAVRKSGGKAILLIMPLLLSLIASGLHMYTMIERVMLFAFPLILILISIGIQSLLNLNNVFVKVLVAACCIICFVNYSQIDKIAPQTINDETTKSLDYLVKWDLPAENIYVNNTAVCAFRYYTAIHPQKGRWRSIKEANILSNDKNYESLSANAKGRSAILFGYIDWGELLGVMDDFKKHSTEISAYCVQSSSVFVFDKK